ncbi:MAG: hypothetical protein NTV77_02035, partial [Candidatus Azambacteria bacterium]|nr:hypothetical protein [Candidatus Azambacteria bacterium]
MNESKIKIIAIAGASILSVLIGYFIWVIFLKTPQPKSKQISAPAFKSGEVTIPKSSSIEGLNIPILPIPKPNIAAFPKEKSLPTSTTSFFENINKAAKAVETKLKNEIATSTQTVPNAPSNANISKPAPT